jgi:Kdo2-lipid IVA lauroyltransferase/acyltransferase
VFLIRFFHWMPLAWVRALGRGMGWLIYWADSAYRQRLQENLQRAGIADASIKTRAIGGIGLSLAESLWLWGSDAALLQKRVVCPRGEWLATLAKSQAPILFLTPHLGTFEVTARFYGTLGPITVLYREPKIKALRGFMAKVRLAGQMKAAPATLGGVKTLLKALKAGEAVGLLPDQVPTSGEGRWAVFFGKPAYTMTLPERLSKVGQAKVVIAVGEPLAGGKWQLHLEEMTETPTPENINQRFEQLIKRFPHLYLWGYNRFKHPLGAPPPPA